MPSLIEFTDQQLLQELYRRANQRDGLALEGHRIGNMSSESYREVVPVEGHYVPYGCEWKVREDPSGLITWEPERKSRFNGFDVKYRSVYCWRVPV